MDKDTHVYCTLCNNLKFVKISDEENDYIPECPYEDECEISNCEDSMRFEDRPCYEPKNSNK